MAILPPDSSIPSKLPSSSLGEIEKSTIQGKRKIVTQTKSIQHDLLWKIWQGTQAFFLTILSVGIGLAFHRLRDQWEKAITGKEKENIVKRWSPTQTSTTEKVYEVSSTALPPLKEKEISKIELLRFIDQLSSNPD